MWVSRAEAIQAKFMLDENKRLDSLNNKLQDFLREDKRLQKMSKANAGWHMCQKDRNPGARTGGRDKPIFKPGPAKPQGQDKQDCSHCGKSNLKSEECRKKQYDEANSGPNKTYAFSQGDKGKGNFSRNGTEIVPLVTTTKITDASKERHSDVMI
jgi:hypothetical protein